eukprot:PhM_4_TR17369/c3_g1_i13/m.33583
MRRCAKLGRETNFLDPEQWYVLVLGMDEKNEVERQLMRRFENMSHTLGHVQGHGEPGAALARSVPRPAPRQRGVDAPDPSLPAGAGRLYQQNDGHSEDYCRVLRNVHAQRELPAFLSDSRREAVQQAKIQGLVVD